MQDLGYFFAYHTQQFMDEPVYVRTTGDWPNQIHGAIQCSGSANTCQTH